MDAPFNNQRQGRNPKIVSVQHHGSDEDRFTFVLNRLMLFAEDFKRDDINAATVGNNVRTLLGNNYCNYTGNSFNPAVMARLAGIVATTGVFASDGWRAVDATNDNSADIIAVPIHTYIIEWVQNVLFSMQNGNAQFRKTVASVTLAATAAGYQLSYTFV